jgi:hypothetical protein
MSSATSDGWAIICIMIILSIAIPSCVSDTISRGIENAECVDTPEGSE